MWRRAFPRPRPGRWKCGRSRSSIRLGPVGSDENAPGGPKGPPAGDTARGVIDDVYRTQSRRVLATLIRLLGDFDRAEEALHDAFSAAVEQWPRDGVPASPRAWLVSAGRFRAIDAL